MSTQDDTYRTLECMLCDKKGKPLSLKQHFLETITNSFSEDNLVGRGGYGEVYKVCENFSIKSPKHFKT
jgi:hypothetical protein